MAGVILPVTVFKWLVDCGAVNASTAVPQGDGTVVVSAGVVDGSAGAAFVLTHVLVALRRSCGVYTRGAPTGISVMSWAEILLALETECGLRLSDAQASALSQGQAASVVAVLHTLRASAARASVRLGDGGDPSEALAVALLDGSDSEAGDEPNIVPLDMEHDTDTVSGALVVAASCAEFTSLSLAHHLDIRPQQAQDLLTRQHKHLHNLMTLGVRNRVTGEQDFEPLCDWLREAHSAAAAIAAWIRNDGDSGTYEDLLLCVKYGLFSESYVSPQRPMCIILRGDHNRNDVVLWSCKVLCRICFVLQCSVAGTAVRASGASPTHLLPFFKNLNRWCVASNHGPVGMDGLVRAWRLLSPTHNGGVAVVAMLWAMLADCQHMIQSSIITTVGSAPDAAVLLHEMLCLLQTASNSSTKQESAFIHASVVAAFMHAFQLCAVEHFQHFATIVCTPQAPGRTGAFLLIVELWIAFASVIEAHTTAPVNGLSAVRAAMKDGNAAMACTAVACIGRMISAFLSMSAQIASAPLLYKALVFSIIDRAVHSSGVRDFVVATLVSLLRSLPVLPAGPVAEALVKHMRRQSSPGEVNTLHMELLRVLADHPRISLRNGLQIAKLAADVLLFGGAFGKAMSGTMLALVSRYRAAQSMRQFLVQWAANSVLTLFSQDPNNSPVQQGDKSQPVWQMTKSHTAGGRLLFIDLLTKIINMGYVEYFSTLRSSIVDAVAEVLIRSGSDEPPAVLAQDTPEPLVRALQLVGGSIEEVEEALKDRIMMDDDDVERSMSDVEETDEAQWDSEDEGLESPVRPSRLPTIQEATPRTPEQPRGPARRPSRKPSAAGPSAIKAPAAVHVVGPVASQVAVKAVARPASPQTDEPTHLPPISGAAAPHPRKQSGLPDMTPLKPNGPAAVLAQARGSILPEQPPPREAVPAQARRKRQPSVSPVRTKSVPAMDAQGAVEQALPSPTIPGSQVAPELTPIIRHFSRGLTEVFHRYAGSSQQAGAKMFSEHAADKAITLSELTKCLKDLQLYPTLVSRDEISAAFRSCSAVSVRAKAMVLAQFSACMVRLALCATAHSSVRGVFAAMPATARVTALFEQLGLEDLKALKQSLAQAQRGVTDHRQEPLQAKLRRGYASVGTPRHSSATE